VDQKLLRHSPVADFACKQILENLTTTGSVSIEMMAKIRQMAHQMSGGGIAIYLGKLGIGKPVSSLQIHTKDPDGSIFQEHIKFGQHQDPLCFRKQY
jgi:hypothetical protein